MLQQQYGLENVGNHLVAPSWIFVTYRSMPVNNAYPSACALVTFLSPDLDDGGWAAASLSRWWWWCHRLHCWRACGAESINSTSSWRRLPRTCQLAPARQKVTRDRRKIFLLAAPRQQTLFLITNDWQNPIYLEKRDFSYTSLWHCRVNTAMKLGNVML